MAGEKILIVEDEEDILELVEYNLKKAGYQVYSVTTGEKAIPEVKKTRSDLILLDLMLPGMDGLDVCRRLKEEGNTRNIPVIMLTAKSEESDIVVGLELGADDYITKPFSPKVLLARIKAVLRRRGRQDTDAEECISIQGLVIDSARHEVAYKEERIALTSTEFSVLRFLANRPGRVFTRQQIVDSVKGSDYAVTERSVDVQMVGLRKKLGAAADLIETVRGVGYRFKDMSN